MFICEYGLGECGKPATRLATWSDRNYFVCDDHVDDARWAHDHDHSYDQTGVVWLVANPRGQHRTEVDIRRKEP